MIQFQKVSKKYFNKVQEILALKDISISIKEGEFIAVIGPSGSGKTTLLNLIGGLEYPTEGEIFFNNKKITSYTDKELSTYRNQSIGFVFQEFYLEPFLTVKENVLLPAYFNHSIKNKRKLADKIIEEVGLKDKTKVLAKELSGGQKQRTAIARALINDPKIILCDEPTGNLDQQNGKNILELLKSLHKKHKTTLIIATHDGAIAKYANRTIHLYNGKIK